MTGLSDALDRWLALGTPSTGEEQGEVSVTLTVGGAADFNDVLTEHAGGHAFELRPAFRGSLVEETGGRFQIVAFPKLRTSGAEQATFEAARELGRLPGVRSARPVLIDSLVGETMVAREEGFELSLFSCSSDDDGPDARGWAPRGLGVLKAWKTSRGAGVTVASIDTGYSSHSQLKGVLSAKPQLNLVEGGADAKDLFSSDVMLPNPGHGTLVASVVASRGDIADSGDTGGVNDVVGTAPEAEILPIRAIRSVVDLRQSRIPAAIEHAIDQRCDVIIMALGSAFPIEPVEVALRAATRKGLVVVCAAGNCVGLVVYPAKFAPLGLCTAVAAVDFAYAPWEKTSKGDAVTISAFGEAVWGASKNSSVGDDDLIKPSQGTTLASSLTAGVAALWVSAKGGRSTLKAHADAAGVTVQSLFNDAVAATAHRPPSGWPRGMGAGLINAAALVAYPLPTPAESMVQVETPLDRVTPLKRLLASTAGEADPLAGLEASGLPEDLAAEALWRLYHSSAAKRAVASHGPSEGLESVAAGTAQKQTPELARSLALRPRLRALAQ